MVNSKFLKAAFYVNRIFTLLTIVFLIPQISNGQFAKGQKLIGGDLSFTASSGNAVQSAFDNRSVYHNATTNIGVNPSIAKFSNPATLHGIGLIYNYSYYHVKEETPDNGNSYNDIRHSGGINIFSQHFITLGSNLFFTIEASATALYSSGKQADVVSKAISKVKGYSVFAALAPGLSYKINKRFLFDAFLNNLLLLGYQRTNTITNYPVPKETKTHSNNVYLSTSLRNTTIGNIGLGFRWLLKNK